MNIKVDFDNIIVKEEKSDTLVKVLMLKGEKGEAGATSWGAITGTLSNQTDLKNALDGKANQSDFSTVSNQVSTNTTNIGTINGEITGINSELDGFEDLFYGNATVNDEDTSITLDNTVEAGFENFDLKGNTSQTGAPTPSLPVDVNVVSGNNSIEIYGENYFDITKISANTFINTSGATGTSSSTNLSDYTNVEPNVQYYLKYDYTSLVNSNTRSYCYYNENKVLISGDTYSPVNKTTSFTPPNNAKYIRFAYDKNCSDIKFIKTNELSTYSINLPSGMELCKIGNYQDYFYKDNDIWYKYGMVGKVVLNGSENIWEATGTNVYATNENFINISTNNNARLSFSNYYIFNPVINNVTSTIANGEYALQHGVTATGRIFLKNTNISNVDDLKTWLSTHNTNVYYILATPTITQITDTTLISQLNALEQATSKNGETNISQVNDDLPFIIYAEAFANTFNGRMEGMDYKIDNCEVLNNKVTSITSGSTDSEYPSAKAVYDLFNSITDGDEVSY